MVGNLVSWSGARWRGIHCPAHAFSQGWEKCNWSYPIFQHCSLCFAPLALDHCCPSIFSSFPNGDWFAGGISAYSCRQVRWWFGLSSHAHLLAYRNDWGRPCFLDCSSDVYAIYAPQLGIELCCKRLLPPVFEARSKRQRVGRCG